MNKLKCELKEIEDKVSEFKKEILVVRWREYDVKFKMKEMFEKIFDIEEKIRKIESCIVY